MLIAIIPIDTIENAKAAMQQAQLADMFELRLDYLPEINIATVKELQLAAHKPVLFTLRKPEQGGLFRGNEASRLALIEKLMTLQPDYIDIEHDVAIDFCHRLKQLAPDTKIIRSYHNFSDTPNDLSLLLNAMINPIFHGYKIITTAQSILDSLRILHFVRTHSAQYHLIAHAMGDLGVVSRILGKVLGNFLSYATVDTNEIAPGLLSLDAWINIYHYPQLNADTKIYGLMGDPIAHSIGHLFHNAEFMKHQQNAVYVKFQVKHEELADFFKAIADLPIAGLSVTMPHKYAVLKYCTATTAKVRTINAANTLIKQSDGYLAANTDGEAVADILPYIKDKHVIVLGAGGAAASIIDSLIAAGAHVSVYNRTKDKLDALRQTYPITTHALHDLKPCDYDVLINTIPVHSCPIDLIQPLLQQEKIIMDACYQAHPTALIMLAKEQGCICFDGYAMFYAQAVLQRKLWFNPHE